MSKPVLLGTGLPPPPLAPPRSGEESPRETVSAPGTLAGRPVGPIALAPPGAAAPRTSPSEQLRHAKGCDPWKWVKIVAVALAIATFVAGTAGLFVWLGKLNISLTGIGSMTQELGLYTMLVGYGFTFLATVLLTVNAFLSRARQSSAQAESTGSLCCGGKSKHVETLIPRVAIASS